MIALAVGAACDGVGLDHEASTASNVADAAVRVAPTAWGWMRHRAATPSVVKRRTGFTDAAAAPSDASQSSVASDQLRTKKGARLRQATKPASAASPPAFDESEGGPAPATRKKKTRGPRKGTIK